MTFEHQKALDDRYVMHTFSRSPVEFVGGKGMRLMDSEGREYLDFLSGIGVCCLGHGHEIVTGALQSQADNLLHVSNYFYIEHRGETAALISKLANNNMEAAKVLARAIVDGDEDALMRAAAPKPGEQVWQTFFANSGAEANEGSMKLARLYAKRSGNKGNTIVALRGSFHGRTLEAVAASMQDRLQEDFKPLPGGFVACSPNDEEELRSIFSELGDEICAVLLEPIQGESGVHPLTESFVRLAAELVHGVGGLLISDEVQAGVFRSGEPFAIQLMGVEPDIMSLAKGIAGGVVAGACVAKSQVADTFRPGDHGSTFGGSCLAVAAAKAVLCELVLGNYAGRVRKVGMRFMRRLSELPHVIEVRGSGLMVGCDLDNAVGDAHDLVAKGLEAGLIFNATGSHTLRFLPPLICSDDDVDEFVAGLSRLL